MVKLIGAIMTGFACAYIGFRMSFSLRTRKTSLENIHASLEMLETEIDFSVNRLKKALISADRCGIFTAAANKLGEKTASGALKEAVYEKQNKLCLTDADCRVVCELGLNLGKLDSKSQIKSIKYVKSLIGELKKNASDEYARLGRLYRGGGILTGLFIVIILI